MSRPLNQGGDDTTNDFGVIDIPAFSWMPQRSNTPLQLAFAVAMLARTTVAQANHVFRHWVRWLDSHKLLMS